MDYLAATLLMLTGMFLILLVLIQRGRGGGLAGAFGGMGGQSAFGTRAGDVFTKITVVAAIIWVVLAGASILALRAGVSDNFQGGSDAASKSPTATAGAGAGSEGSDDLDSVLAPKDDSMDPSEGDSETSETPSETADPAKNSDAPTDSEPASSESEDDSSSEKPSE